MTRRQKQVFALVAAGYTDSVIADKLGIGVRTVHTHVSQVRLALGARNRAHAVALGLAVGILYFDEEFVNAR